MAWNSRDLRTIASGADTSVPPHQLEKAKRVPNGMNLAHLIRVNSRNRDCFDPKALATGNDEHFSVVVESVATAKQLWNQLSIYHAETTLRVGNLLSADPADAPAHVAVHDAPDE